MTTALVKSLLFPLLLLPGELSSPSLTDFISKGRFSLSSSITRALVSPRVADKVTNDLRSTFFGNGSVNLILTNTSLVVPG